MMSSYAYYNEHDPKAAAWLRELIREGVIAPGDVDERSIEDVLPNELAGYTQCHFFAGIGVWSYALRRAGWPDDRPVWTGSCPCQPFSQAGEGKGFADERHLWPAFYWLISQRRPDVVFGEQVESKDGRAWLDTVQSDLEASGYAVGAVGLCAAGFGAPHIRQRLFFVADAARDNQQRLWQSRTWDGRWELSLGGYRTVGGVADSVGSQRWPATKRGDDDFDRPNAGRQEAASGLEFCGEAGELGNANGLRFQRIGGREQSGVAEPSSVISLGNSGGAGFSLCQSEELCGARGRREGRTVTQPSATNGFWASAEWLYCRDGKYRPTQPGLFPLAHGVAARVVKLRGAGNAIVAPVAEEFIRAYLICS